MKSEKTVRVKYILNLFALKYKRNDENKKIEPTIKNKASKLIVPALRRRINDAKNMLTEDPL